MRARDGAVSGSLGVSGAREQGDTVKSVVRKPETLLEPAQLQNAKMVACGASHTLVLTGVGDVFAFGHGEHGKLAQGQGNEFDQFQPKQVRLACRTLPASLPPCLLLLGARHLAARNLALHRLHMPLVSRAQQPCCTFTVLCLGQLGGVGCGVGTAGICRRHA